MGYRSRSLPQSLPPFVRAAEQFAEINSFVSRPGSVCQNVAFYIEVACSGTSVAGLTPMIILPSAGRSRRVLSILEKFEGTLTGQARGGFWHDYIRNLRRKAAKDALLPLNVFPAVEAIRSDPRTSSVDFAIATYEPMNAVRDRARLRRCFRLFENSRFSLGRPLVDKALDRCGTLDIRHIGAGMRDGRTLVKCYAEGSLRAMLDSLSPRALAPFLSAGSGALNDLAARLGTKMVAQTALDFFEGRLVRLGVEIEAPQFKALGSRDQSAVLGARVFTLSPPSVRRRLASLLRRRNTRMSIAGKPFVCGLAHLKASFDSQGEIRWKAYFVVHPL